MRGHAQVLICFRIPHRSQRHDRSSVSLRLPPSPAGGEGRRGQAMKAQGITRTAMSVEMETRRAQLNRVLDPDASNMTLDTLSRGARVLGRSLKVELV